MKTAAIPLAVFLIGILASVAVLWLVVPQEPDRMYIVVEYWSGQ